MHAEEAQDLKGLQIFDRSRKIWMSDECVSLSILGQTVWKQFVCMIGSAQLDRPRYAN